MRWNLNQIAKWTNAEIISEKVTEFDEIGTDTRKNLTGQIFIALKGDQFDAHLYLDKALVSGACALIVHELPEKFKELKNKVTILKVKDTLEAIQNFAQGYRLSLNTKVIGITGSNGKTTTKEFTAQILAPYKKTHYSQGSFNNHWGVPITLLSIPVDTEFAVVEMGMNHAGEIQKLVEIAVPDIVVCTMVGNAHIEFFGTQKKIAEAKNEIYLYSKPETIRIFNQDQDLTFDMMYPSAKKFPEARMLSFSERNNEADVYFKIEELSMRGMKITGLIATKADLIEIPVFGKQNLTNLMASATIAYACGLSPEQIWQAMPQCKTSWGRNQFIETAVGAEILFDGYNANPDSMNALLDNVPLLKSSGKKIAVFGQMKELGTEAQQAHRALGLKAGQVGFEQIFFIGEDAKYFLEGLHESEFKGSHWVQSEFSVNLGEQLQSSLQKNDLVVIKGSRGAQTERFISYCQPLNWVNKS
jgi:UDP-N-acetylmuramoyl-tripeptide--D-alanyl-D-alanine ligase